MKEINIGTDVNCEIKDNKVIFDKNVERCSTCKTFKYEDDFGPNKARKSGLNSNCKVCNTDINAVRRNQLMTKLKDVENMQADIKYKIASESLQALEVSIKNTLINTSKITKKHIDEVNEFILDMNNFISEKVKEYNDKI